MGSFWALVVLFARAVDGHASLASGILGQSQKLQIIAGMLIFMMHVQKASSSVQLLQFPLPCPPQDVSQAQSIFSVYHEE